MRKAFRFAILIRPLITAPSRPPSNLASDCTSRPGSAAGAAPKRKWSSATGAEWIWNLANQHFPGAVQIVDLYHARQHLWELARLLYPNDRKRQNAWIGLHQKRWLDKGKIDKLVASMRSIRVLDADLARRIRNHADYFASNAARMNYPLF